MKTRCIYLFFLLCQNAFDLSCATSMNVYKTCCITYHHDFSKTITLIFQAYWAIPCSTTGVITSDGLGETTNVEFAAPSSRHSCMGYFPWPAGLQWRHLYNTSPLPTTIPHQGYIHKYQVFSCLISFLKPIPSAILFYSRLHTTTKLDKY